MSRLRTSHKSVNTQTKWYGKGDEWSNLLLEYIKAWYDLMCMYIKGIMLYVQDMLWNTHKVHPKRYMHMVR